MELLKRVKRYYRFTPAEAQALILTIIVTGFIFSFKDWGVTNFKVSTGILNFLLATLISAFIFFIHETAHRIYALKQGIITTFQIWPVGLLISLIVTFTTNGAIAFVLPGGITASILTKQRLGEFRYGLNVWQTGLIALAGPVATAATAILFKLLLSLQPGNWFFQKGLLMSIILTVTFILPLPKLDGIMIYFASRTLWIFSFLSMLIFALLIFKTSILISLFSALILAAGAAAVWYFSKE